MKNEVVRAIPYVILVLAGLTIFLLLAEQRAIQDEVRQLRIENQSLRWGKTYYELGVQLDTTIITYTHYGYEYVDVEDTFVVVVHPKENSHP